MSGKIRIAWWGKHFGEEPPLVGDPEPLAKLGCGAGTVFFTGCNLKCVFCQNYQISQQGIGKNYTVEGLVTIMLDLQAQGAINIDLVSPTLYSKLIAEALVMAKQKGLSLPIVWNSNGYETVEILKSLEGLIDLYLPDFKYADDSLAEKYSGVKNYTEIATRAIQEMWRQVGNLKLNSNGLAERGLIVRHLILPNQIENSKKVLEIIKSIDSNMFVSLMSQYAPLFKTVEYLELNRTLNEAEFQAVYSYLQKLNLTNGWVQELSADKVFVPDFIKEQPFSN